MLTQPDNVPLSKWIDYIHELRPLDERMSELSKLPPSKRKDVLITRNYVDTAYMTIKFFDIPNDGSVDDVIALYREFNERFSISVSGDFKPSDIADLKHGQFIDAKMMCVSGDKWSVLRYLCAIFKRGVTYKATDISEDSESFKMAGEMMLTDALKVSDWFDKLNTYILENYTLFQEDGVKDDNPHMKEHLSRWGWVNFLKSIAKTKVFDISGSGLNSIDCAREASLDDVLTWASEEKDYNTAAYLDMQDR